MPEENQEQPIQPGLVKAQLHYMNNDQEPFLYANQMLIRRLPEAVAISFAVSHGPFELTLDPEKIAKEGVRADIVTKIVVTNDRFQAFAKVFERIADSIVKGDPTDDYRDNEFENDPSGN